MTEPLGVPAPTAAEVDPMRLWVSLYLMTWVVFIEFWLALTPLAPPVPYYVHAVLGVVIVALAYFNSEALRASTAPGRIKRVARATFSLTLLLAFLGALLFLRVGYDWTVLFGITFWGGIAFLHFVNAVAILTQSSAVAIAFDMWEDKEYLLDTAPGEVPAPTVPAPLAVTKPS
jgi:hypothetical protein